MQGHLDCDTAVHSASPLSSPASPTFEAECLKPVHGPLGADAADAGRERILWFGVGCAAPRLGLEGFGWCKESTKGVITARWHQVGCRVTSQEPALPQVLAQLVLPTTAESL